MAKTANINIRAETEAAMQEARAIMNGQVQTKRYSCASALFEELEAEGDGEDS